MRNYVLLLLSLVVVFAGCVQNTNTLDSQISAQVGSRIAIHNLVPNSDVGGEDIIPRPDGFVRAEFSRTEDGADIIYRIKGNSFQDSINFYRNYFDGWTPEGESSSAQPTVSYDGFSLGVEKELTLNYLKDDEDVSVMIRLLNVGKEQVTEVEISYYKTPPDTSAESAYTPLNKDPYITEVPKYADAVLYDQRKTQIMSVTEFIDKYYVQNGNIDDIYEFYDKISIPGMTKKASQLNVEDAVIAFSDENNLHGITVNLEIDGKYVLIEVMKESLS